MKLYDNAFSPFARKVRLVLDHKGLEYETLNGLAKKNHAELKSKNSRVEVPALMDQGHTISNSEHIIAYLEHAYPDKPVYLDNPVIRAKALAWERCADTVIDPILVNISYWTWAERPDEMPDGLFEKAAADLNILYDRMNEALEGQDYFCGTLSIADLALFPHLSAIKTLGVPFNAEKHPNLIGWMKRMMGLDICKADLDRLRAFFKNADLSEIELKKIFWRGDRIEWMLARGFQNWFLKEIEEDRVLWPGLWVP